MFNERVQNYDFLVDPSNANVSTTKFIAMIPPGSRVLEVGCANGTLSRYLTEELKCDVVGIELNPETAENAKKHCSRVVVGDIESGALEQVGENFDVITFGDVLEHLVLPGVALAKCRNLLSKNGFVLISIPNVAHYSVRFRLLFGQFDYEQYGLLDRTHLRFFTERTAKQLLSDSGYRVEHFDTVCMVRGWRLIEKYEAAQSMLKRRLAGLIAYQLIFKAVPCRAPAVGNILSSVPQRRAN